MLSSRNLYLAQYFSQITQLVNSQDNLVMKTFQRMNLLGFSNHEKTENIYNLLSSFEYSPEESRDYWQKPS